MIDKKFAYKILKAKNLVIKYYKGEFSLPELIASANFTGHDIDFKPTMNVVNDLRDSIIIAEETEIEKLINYYKENQKLYAERKVAFITSSPNQVVFGLMLTNFKNEALISINTFSTLSPAIEWVELPISDLEMIENCIDELKIQVKNS